MVICIDTTGTEAVQRIPRCCSLKVRFMLHRSSQLIQLRVQELGTPRQISCRLGGNFLKKEKHERGKLNLVYKHPGIASGVLDLPFADKIVRISMTFI